MKQFSAVFFLLAVLLAGPLFGQTVVQGRCVGVTDGDSVKVLEPNNILVRVRLSFIDAPELGQAFGYRVKQAMSALVFGKEVELQERGLDRYGRTLALVFVDGKDAGLELMKQGLCWPYYRYLPEADPDLQKAYLEAADTAKEQHLGLWLDPNPVEPWVWRKERRAAEAWVRAHSD